MSYDLEPTIGSWYYRIDDEQTFKVVDIDEENDLIELRFADGEVEEISVDAWREMDLEIGAEPDDWRGDDDDEDEDEDDDELDDDDDDSDEWPEDDYDDDDDDRDD